MTSLLNPRWARNRIWRAFLPHPRGARRTCGRQTARRALQLGPREFADGIAHERVADSARTQFLPDPRGAKALAAAARQDLGEAAIGKQFLRFQLAEQVLQLVGGFGVGRELAREFGAAVLAPCQIAQRPGEERFLLARARCVSVASSSTGIERSRYSPSPGATRPRHRAFRRGGFGSGRRYAA